MGRGVETAIIENIIHEAEKNGIKQIKAQFIPTNKNKPSENFLLDSGFKEENDFWIRNVDKKQELPSYINVEKNDFIC